MVPSGMAWRCLYLLVAAMVPGLLPAWEDLENRAITEVQFDPASQPLERRELDRLVGFAAGDPYQAGQIRTAIERLYATGRYHDIVVEAEPRDAGVVVRFRTVKNWFASRITVAGVPDPPNASQLVNATKMDLGTRYSDEQVTEAVRGLRSTLLVNGFYHPRIQPLVTRYPERDELHIEFLVQPGHRAAYTDPQIAGNPEVPIRRLIRISRWMDWYGLFGWKAVTDTRTQQGVERIRQSYLKRNQILSKVRLERLDYRDEDNTVSPALLVEAGPRVDIVATGAKLSRNKLKELVPIYQERTVDQSLLVEGQRKIIEYLQSQGYFDADATFEQKEKAPKQQLIEYAIDRGPRYRLAALFVTGNKYFDNQTIRERIYETPATLLRYRRGRYSQTLLERDKEAIRDLYANNGFRDVEVESRVESGYKGKDLDLALHLEIKEGEQWTVSRVDLSGVDLRLYEYIYGLITSQVGQPYSTFTVASDRDTILSYYYNNGYPNATLDVISTQGPGPRQMALKFVVTENRRQYVKGVIVNGLETTKPDLVDRRILLKAGEPLSQSRMVETQRRLYDLGIFAKVDVAVQNPDGLTREKEVLFQVEEASRYSFNGGIGAEIAQIGSGTSSIDTPVGGTGFSPRVSLGVTRLNAFGTGNTIGVQGRLSNLQQRGLVTYFAPRFRGKEDLNLTLSMLYDRSQNIRTYTSRRFEVTALVGKKLSRSNVVQFRGTFREVSLSDVNILPSLVPLLAQAVRVGLVGATFIRDRRDDPIDSTRGSYNTVDFSVASKVLSSQTDYVRLLWRNSSYYRLSKDVVFARNLTFGSMIPTTNKAVPLPELFYGGGASSHRGFPENQAGPRDEVTGFPVGGRAILVNQTEVRFPLIGDNVRGVLFHDMGNVYSTPGDISFRYSQKDLLHFNYMVQSVGFGIRYRTPIGPIRVDLAYGLNSPQFHGFVGTREELANIPPNTPIDMIPQKTLRIPAFQFHFSLGQSF